MASPGAGERTQLLAFRPGSGALPDRAKTHGTERAKPCCLSRGATIMDVELAESAQARFRVRYAETDQMGVVHHANYLPWFEMARTDLCAARGVRYRDIEANDGLLLTVVEVQCRYHAPARYDEEILAEARLKNSHPRMIVFTYEIRNAATSQLLVTGETRHVFITREGRPVKVPRKYYELFGITSAEDRTTVS